MIQTVPIPCALSTPTKRPVGGFLKALLHKILTGDRTYRERGHLSRLPDYDLADFGMNRNGASARPPDRAGLRW